MIWWGRALVDLALTGYLWATVQALAELTGRRGVWPVPTRTLLATGWVLHTLGLALRAVALGGPPVGGLHAALSMIVWAAVLLLLWGERRYALRALPAFVLVPVALLSLGAAAAPESAVFAGSGAPGGAGHALFIVLGLGALAGNFAGGLMYILQERALKRGRRRSSRGRGRGSGTESQRPGHERRSGRARPAPAAVARGPRSARA